MNIHLILAGVFALAGVVFFFFFLWMKRIAPQNERPARDVLFLIVGAMGSAAIGQIVQVVMPIMESKKVLWGYNAWDAYAVAGWALAVFGGIYSIWRGMWKGKLRTAGVVQIGFVLALTVCSIFYLFTAHRDNALDDESRQFADAAIRAICSNWDVKEMEVRASPEFMSALKDTSLEKTFATLRRLGRLQNIRSFQGEVNDSATVDHAKAIVAVYTADAVLEAGPAEIKATCIKHGNQWQVMGFHVIPKAFLPCP